MDFRVTDTTASVCEILADTFSEQPVDGDFVLPEYCPDVAAVLKCTMRTAVQNRQMSADRYMADGTVYMRVLYLDEDRKSIYCYECSQPFSASFPVSDIPAGAFFCLNSKTDYLNCRAVSPRRLDIHGAFTLRLQIKAPIEKPAIAAIEGDGVYTRRQVVYSTVPAACAEKPFTVSETLEPEEKHPAEQMLCVHMMPVITDCKLLSNKAIVKGNLTYEALYLTNAADGAIETVQGDLPFSQIMDMDGLTEEWVCDADVQLISDDLHMGSSPNGDNGLLTINAKLLVTLYGWREESRELCSDAYSAHCPLQNETQSVEAYYLTGVTRDEQTVRQLVQAPSDAVEEILYVWCDAADVAMTGSTDDMAVAGRLLWCVLVRDGDGVISYYERSEAFSVPCADGSRDDAPEVRVTGSYGCMNGGKMELKADLSIVRRCGKTRAYTVLGNVTADESAAYPEDKAALKICYAKSGESVWDIARRCRTSVEAVMEENHLTGDTLSADAMLLIPLC